MHFRPLLATLLALPFSLAAPAPSPFKNELLAPVRIAAAESPRDILPRDTDSSYSGDENFQSEILAHHNRLRSEHNTGPLSWDPKLASAAADLANRCVFQHSGGPYGENIAIGYPSVRDTCYGWGENERKEYSPGEYDNPTYNMKTGHFTQMIWAETKNVGCARKDCDGRWFVVCEYVARGNVRGAEYYRKNVLKPKEGVRVD